MTDRGEPLAVADDASLREFVEAMRENVAGMTGAIFGTDEDDLRLASLSATFVSGDGYSASSSIDAQWFEEGDFEHGIDEYQRLAEEFASNNDLEPDDAPSQWDVVEEEFRELREEFERLRFDHVPEFGSDGWGAAAGNKPVEPLAEEMADAVFTIHLLARMLGVDLRREFVEKAEYNLEKSGERDENGKIIDDAEASDD